MLFKVSLLCGGLLMYFAAGVYLFRRFKVSTWPSFMHFIKTSRANSPLTLGLDVARGAVAGTGLGEVLKKNHENAAVVTKHAFFQTLAVQNSPEVKELKRNFLICFALGTLMFLLAQVL